jgi:site-specific DNA-methyltransferase (adenine-specific)
VPNPTVIGDITIHHGDCLDLMRATPDGAFDLAVVDPPYGIGAAAMQMGTGKNKGWTKKTWDSSTPGADYFEELFRVSKRQIIWGGNYFDLPQRGGWIFWDKELNKDISFGDGELAWTNFLTVVKKAPVQYSGFLGADVERIHPTQKPVQLYRWLLTRHAQPGDRLLDTHLGSGSSAVAAVELGFQLTACEIDADYFQGACRRIEQAYKQRPLFEAEPQRKPEQLGLEAQS